MPERPRLSVLIPTIPQRLESYQSLVERLLQQAAQQPVEILALLDNRQRTVGEKRTDLVATAAGQYLTFVDDDDDVPGDYLAALLAGIADNQGADCITFDRNVWFHGHFSHRMECRVGIGESRVEHRRCTGAPNHIALYRTALAQQVPFPALGMGEDNAWYDRIVPLIQTTAHLDRVLYEYRYDPLATMTQRPAQRVTAAAPVTLSILIPTVPTRLRTFWPALVSDLLAQTSGRPVEVLSLLDNFQRTVGEKRNALLGMARGDYMAFIDDDDRVAPTYVQTLLAAIGQAAWADVIVFDQLLCEVSSNNRQKLCRYGLEHTTYHDGPTLWTGPPAHTQCWRTALAQQCTFPSFNYTEDSAWVKQAVALAETQCRVEGPPLYFYDYNPKTSETRKANRRNVNRR